MKGLLMKDFKLLIGQKNFFFTIIIIGIALNLVYDNVLFVLGFFPFMLSQFTLSTISYDEFDNGNAFLFSLPITRKQYAIEKYVFGFLLGFVSVVLAIAVILVLDFANSDISLLEVLLAAGIVYIFVMLVQAVMLPLQLKFGSERGRIAIIGAFALLGAVGFLFIKLVQLVQIEFMETLVSIPMGWIIAGILILVLVLLLISMKISVVIMEQKEF